MLLMLGGIVVIVATASVFVALLPRDGRTYRLAGTEYEPYVAVAFTAAIALAFTMILSGGIDYFSQ